MTSSPASRPPILRATARDRVVACYAVDPAPVAAQLPAGLVPDTREGRAFVELVGVRLVQVRVLGLAGPGFRRVPAVELRVLVREDGASARRGTMTIRAHVPRRLVAWGARGLYGEPVATASMQTMRRERDEGVRMTYRFDVAGREQRLRATAEGPPTSPAAGTLAHFLRDRPWRYGTARDGTLLRARLERSEAALYAVDAPHVTVRWGAVYGAPWGALADRTPTTAFFSPGGPVALRWRERIGGTPSG